MRKKKKVEAPDYKSVVANGYDKDLSNPKEDLLDRVHIATAIFDVISSTPADSSVRIGVYGEWGLGKTTVMNFVEEQAKSHNFPFIRFNPWSYSSQGEMMLGLSTAILDGLEDSGIDVTAISEGRQRLAKYSPIIEKAALQAKDFAGELQNPLWRVLAKGAAFGLAEFSAMFGISSEFLEKLRHSLGTRKLVIAIDDLDRTDPKLVPKLLLTLREVLDLPGFSFILAIDRDKVAKAISQDHPNWGTGHEFLEKIIDFPFFLPKATASQRHILFNAEFLKQCDFAKSKATKAVAELLPSNPRKIKAVVRNIRALKGEISRHAENEIDWETQYIIAILMVESPQLMELIRLEVADQARVRQLSSVATSDDEEAKKRNDLIAAIVSKVHDVEQNEEKQTRLIQLFSALIPANFYMSAERTLYQIEMSAKPHSITWKEFQTPFDAYKASGKLDLVDQWLEETAKRRNASVISVADEFIDTALLYYAMKLEDASGVEYLDQHDSIMSDAVHTLNLIEIIMVGGLRGIPGDYICTRERVVKFLDIVGQWSNFAGNHLDRSARERELQVIQKILECSEGNIIDLYEVIQRKIGREDFGVEGVFSVRDGLLKVLRSVESQVCEEVLRKFHKAKAVVKMYPDGAEEVSKFVLLNPASVLFKQPMLGKLHQLAAEAKNNPAVHDNLKEYLTLIARRIGRGTRYVSHQEVGELLQNDGLLSLLWTVTVGRQLQFRGLQECRQDRQKLITAGAKEALFPVPTWLTVSKESLIAGKGKSPPGHKNSKTSVDPKQTTAQSSRKK